MAENMGDLYGLEISCDVVIGNRLPQDCEVVLLRTVRELIVNVVKHAEASNVQITAGEECGRFVIRVRDNGEGFSLDNILPCKKQGLGLFSIRERLYALSGTFDIESEDGGGTTATITIPVCV